MVSAISRQLRRLRESPILAAGARRRASSGESKPAESPVQELLFLGVALPADRRSAPKRQQSLIAME